MLQDPQYRTTVAAMLAQQTADENQPSQFIITTFHPQIIQQADKVYGVSHTNRISRIDVVSQARTSACNLGIMFAHLLFVSVHMCTASVRTSVSQAAAVQMLCL